MRQSMLAINLTVAVAILTSLSAPGWSQGMPAETLPAQPAAEAPSPSEENQIDLPDSQTVRDQSVTPPSISKDEAILKVQEANLMKGDKDGKFHAERALSRAELASILVKTFDLGSRKAVNPETEVLKDVPSQYWAADDINTVIRLGIMKGYRDGYFYPEQRISRSEALAIFAQAYGVQQYDDATVKTILAPYSDAKQIPDWAEKAMATTLKNGFLDIGASGKIRPMQPMTRGDMAFALGQYLNRLHESEQRTLH